MSEPAYIVYDGDCPFCTRYVKMLRLRDAMGPVELVNARTEHPVVDMLKAEDVDLDEGMALVQDGQISHGDECMHKLALMTTPSGLLNTLNARIFSSERASRILYPFLRFGRNTALAVMGRRKLNLNKP
ncbi:MAG: thiol-disulfide oxidoreductase DCC family protein [Alphaproteobacteria bacterium]